MNLSRFVGATSREALRQVRLALGPEALIVSNRRVNGGVEILASDPTSATLEEPGIEPGPHPEAPAQGVMGAIESMRGALEARLDEAMWGNRLRQAPQTARLFQSLLGLGFSTALLRAMLTRLPAGLGQGAAMRWVRDELARHLPVLAREDDLWKPGLVLALVGPTGVGKTTTVAKLAARCVRRTGPAGLVLVTTDTYRIGAHEQLKQYGDMLHVPVHVVRNADELRRLLGSAHPSQTVLIDNVGVSQRDRYVAEQAALLAGGGRQVNRLVVLNASSHGDTLDEVARTYTADGGGALAGCLITKIDEAPRIAAALDTAIRYRLAVHYVSDGQRVPENLRHRSPAELVDLALTRAGTGRDLFAPTEADLAALMEIASDDAARAVGSREQRRMRLLPGLLTGGDGRQPTLDALRRASERLDDAPACAEAFGLWRAFIDEGAAVDAAASSRHLSRSAADASAAQGTALAALHGRARLDLPDGVPGELHATALFDAGMTSLTVPALQLALAGSWQPVWGDPALSPPAAEAALLERLAWLDRDPRSNPLVHLLHGMSATTARRLAEGGHAWLAACAARTMVVSDAGAGPIAALARELVFRPLADPAHGASASPDQLSSKLDLTLWVAHAPVHLSRRSATGPALEAVVVRMAESSGRVGRIWCGLANAEPSDAGLDRLAHWLVSMDQAKQAFRHMGTCWRLLAQSGPPSKPALHQALTAAQMGLAVWQAGKDAALSPVLRALTPGRFVPHVALSRLFTFKEVLEREEGASA